jgi:DNA-cytosine methyltransferase
MPRLKIGARALRSSFSLPKGWREILLIEDNAARAERRVHAGVATHRGKARVYVSLHRVTSDGCRLIGERAYRAGFDRKRSVRAAAALKLVDSVRILRPHTVVVAGAAYGSNSWFLAQLAARHLKFVVEVRPSTPLLPIDPGARKRKRVMAARLLRDPSWGSYSLRLPTNGGRLRYRAAGLSRVELPYGESGRLFAGQTGGILGFHRGTILAISSENDASLRDMLHAVAWTRWIRPITRERERQIVVKVDAKPIRKQRGKLNGAHITVRANIKVASGQDIRAKPVERLSTAAAPLRGVLASTRSVLNVVELFAGAGGMGLGFLQSGNAKRHFRLVFSGEVSPIYVETLRTNHAAYQESVGARENVPQEIKPTDLRTHAALTAARRAAREFGGVDVVIGGPPCQGFSNANRNSWHSKNPNNKLVNVFLTYVEALKPKVFLLENVQGILWTPRDRRSPGSLSVVMHLARRMARAGYHVFPKLLDAVWYGVPQYRSRFFLLGIRNDMGYLPEHFGQWGPFPLPTHGPGRPFPFVTVQDAIGDLPRIGNGALENEASYEDLPPRSLARNAFLSQMRLGASQGVIVDHITSRHAPYVIERYRRIPPGGNWESIADSLTNYAAVHRTHSNIYRRLSWREPSITIGHYRKSMLVHPSQHRGLSLREASRLQSFPDWFRFSGGASGERGGLVHKQQQLANAVCPLVTKALAEFILNL